jgi:hypothetical protein
MLQTSIPEPFQPSPLFEAVTEKEFESEDEGHLVNIKQQNKSQVVSVSSPPRSSHNEKDRNGNSVARIKVVVCAGSCQCPRNLYFYVFFG